MKVKVSSPTEAVRQAEKPDRLAGSSRNRPSATRSGQDPVRVHTARVLLVAAVLGGVLSTPMARAQAPAQPPTGAGLAQPLATAAPASSATTRPSFDDVMGDLPQPLPDDSGENVWAPEFLKSLPRPPAQPSSLFQPAPAPGPPPPNFEQYFEQDPLLDPPAWGKTGWFSDVQVSVIRPTIFFGQMRHGVITPSGARVNVAPGAAKQDWTAAPRIEIGYRLPSGFGGFSFSDRFFNTSGSGPFTGPIGTVTRSTSMGVNYSDWDYFSPEYTQWENWNLMWRFGVRLAETWIDTQAEQSTARAAAGTGVVNQQTSNYTVGAGPHFGLQLDRKFPASGFSLVGRFDIANTFTRERQLFSATTLNPSGGIARSAWTENFWQQVPILNYQLGVGWQPPRNPNVFLYVGYVYEFWWQVASNTNLVPSAGGPRGAFDNQGVIFQGQVKF